MLKLFSNPNPWEKKSFSQSGEDLIIKFIFDSIGIKSPSFIDIGAHHPFYLSNTAIFYLNGSSGVNIEPDPYLFKEFIKYRNNDINLNVGIHENESTMDFYLMNIPTLNTFSLEEANKYAEEKSCFIKDKIEIKVFNINSIIEKYCNGTFPDFMTLDAEGIDELVLKSIDYNNNSPKVICVETISFSTNGNGIKNDALIKFIESKGYILYADTYINSIFVKKNLWIRH